MKLFTWVFFVFCAMDNVRIFFMSLSLTGADPGFSVGGGANPPGGCASI